MKLHNVDEAMSLVHHSYRRSLSPFFNPQCPNNAKWYACPKTSRTKFVGCCSIDPCNLDKGCSANNLQPASFNATILNTPDYPPKPSCGASTITPYSCSGPNGSTFWGCCRSDPCQDTTRPPTCSSNDLTQSFLETDHQFEGYSATPQSSSSSGSSSSGDNGNKNGNTNQSSTSEYHVSKRVIAGATVGGVVALAIIVAVLIFCLKKKQGGKDSKKDSENATDIESPNNTAPPRYSMPNSHHQSGLAPPDYGQKGYYEHVPSTPMELPGDTSHGNVMAELPMNNSDHPVPLGRTTSYPVSPLGPHAAELESPNASHAVPATS